LKHVSTDVYGPFTAEDFESDMTAKKIFIFTITDRCSRFTKIRFTEKINSEAFLKFLKKEWVDVYGIPLTVYPIKVIVILL
ncbi:hypothetical protein M153_3810006091, partial [Pseudoloma neurophilia]